MRKLDWAALILVIIVAVGGQLLGFGGSVPENHTPRRPSPELFEPLYWDAETKIWLQEGAKNQRAASTLTPSLLSEGYIENDDSLGSSTGTAFSVSSAGYWLTARHVIEGCDEAYLQIADDSGVKVSDSYLHPQADVAMLVTEDAPDGLLISTAVRSIHNSFNVGFPKGEPGAVHGQFLGEMTMRHVGQRRYRERVYAWSIQSEIPHRFASLGGLSGGAVIDGGGNIVGIVQSESPRRGRFMTARPETLVRMFDIAGIDIPTAARPASASEISGANYENMARDLIVSLRVAKVLCYVD